MSVRRANSPFMTADEIQADPVERLAAHLYETEPGPPGPSDPPYGSDQTPIVERRRYRAKALRMLAADDMLEALEKVIRDLDDDPYTAPTLEGAYEAISKAKGQTP